LEPFFLAGKKINQERNMLYKTPQQAKTPLSILRKTPGNLISHTPRGIAKQLFPQDDAQEEQTNNMDSTMDLNVTSNKFFFSASISYSLDFFCADILENLSGSEDTLCLFAGLEETMGTALEGFKRRRYKIGASLRSRKQFTAGKNINEC